MVMCPLVTQIQSMPSLSTKAILLTLLGMKLCNPCFLKYGAPYLLPVKVIAASALSNYALCVLAWTAVNTAARMEQTTVASTIQLSHATKSLLPPQLDLELLPTGGVPVKVGEAACGGTTCLLKRCFQVLLLLLHSRSFYDLSPVSSAIMEQSFIYSHVRTF